MAPGGLGVQEGSMSGIYALFGVPFQQAVLAAILFRVLYYFVPYLFSLSLYRRLLRRVQDTTP
ncbi:MAG: lysylphosphatidylglycerol synthase domain-containing protein [Anaerolineae bacterium]